MSVLEIAILNTFSTKVMLHALTSTYVYAHLQLMYMYKCITISLLFVLIRYYALQISMSFFIVSQCH